MRVDAEPVLLVLDDLHWAAKPTLFLLRHLLRSTESARLLVLGIYRDTDLGRTHPLADLLADLRRSGASERVSLVGLDEAGVATLVQDASGAAQLDARGRELARVIHAETEGNAFFVGEVVRHLVETETLGAELASLRVPEGVREVVGRRLARLSVPANATLSLGAVIGRDFELALLERAGDLPEEELLRALDEAVATRLVEEPGAGQYRFAHALVHSVVYDELRSTRRAALHGRVANALEQLSDDRVVQLAYHFAEAAAGGDPSKAIQYARLAGDQALAQLAPDEAAAYFRRALDMLEDAGDADPHLSCDLTIALGDAQRQSGNPEHREILFAAAAQARALGDADRHARAAIANERPWGWSSTGEVDEERVAVMRGALDLLGTDDSAARACLLGHLACELVFADDLAQCDALSAEALAIARRIDDDSTLGRVLHLRSIATLRTSTPAERRGFAGETLMVAERLGDPQLRLLALMNGAAVSVELADLERARDALGASRRIVDDLHQPAASGFVLVWESALATLCGDFETGERLAFEAFGLADDAGDRDAELILGAQLFNLRLLQGRLPEMEQLLVSSVERGLSEASAQGLLAALYSETERPVAARTALAAAAADGFGGLHRDPTWLAILANTAQACAHLRDAARAEVLSALLAPYRDFLIVGGPTVWGAGSYYLGLLSATRGQLDDADVELAAAADLHDRIGARPWLARTEVARARVLIERGRVGDHDHARVLAAAALATARELGLAGTEREATTLLDAAP